MISATQLRPGMIIKFNNELYSVFSMTHRTPGNLRGFVQAKMRSLKSGTMTEHRFSSEDKVEKAQLEEHEMEYLYDDGEYYYFMNTETFEQMHLMKDLLGDAVQYLIPQLKGGLRQCDVEIVPIGSAAIDDFRIQIERGDGAVGDCNARNAVIHYVSAQIVFEQDQVERVGVRHEEIARDRVHGETQVDGSHFRVIRDGRRCARFDGHHAIGGHLICDKGRPCRVAGRHDESRYGRRRQERIHGGNARLPTLRGRSAWGWRLDIRDQRGSVSSQSKGGIDSATVRTDRHRPRAVPEDLNRARQSLRFGIDHRDLMSARNTGVGRVAGKYDIHRLPRTHTAR